MIWALAMIPLGLIGGPIGFYVGYVFYVKTTHFEK